MPITAADLKFFASERMTETDDGGGQMTATEIVPGAENAIFDDITDVDRAAGDISIRKVFASVTSADAAKYLDAGVVVFAPPTESATSVSIFTTSSPYDERADLQDRVEAYLYKGPTWAGYLLDNHIIGMRAINVLQQVGSALPVIGQTLCLVEDEDLESEVQQYVRVTEVDAVETTFEDSKGTFTRWVVTMSLSDALRSVFHGHAAERQDDQFSFVGKARIRTTQVADATTYYSTQPLTASAAVGDYAVRAASIFTQLVPSAQTESPLVNQIMAGAPTLTLDAGDDHTVEVTQSAQTLFRQVTPENRRLNWIETLKPAPAAGTLSVSYMAQGNWYLLSDDGEGLIAGSDPAYGAGTVNYTSGSVAVTLGALPDAGSQILLVWGTAAHYTQRLTADVTPPVWEYVLGQADEDDTTPFSVDPGSVTITWEASGVTKTLTDDGSNLLQGDGYGAINYASGALWFRPSVLPDPATTPVVTYDRASKHVETFTPSKDGNGFVTVNLANTPVTAGSILLEWETIREKTVSEKVRGEAGQVSYYSASTEYSEETSLEDASSWRRPNFKTVTVNRPLGSYSYVALTGYNEGGTSTSTELSSTEKDKIRRTNKERTFFERESDTNESNIVVSKTAPDDGAGAIIGPQAGTADYATGAVRFIPTDIARSHSFGVTSGGSVSQDLDTEGGSTTSETTIGSNRYQMPSGVGRFIYNVTGTTAGASTTSSIQTTGSAGHESTASEGAWGSEAIGDAWGDGSLIRVRYSSTAMTPAEATETLPQRPLRITFNPYNGERLVPGSLRFNLGSTLYADNGAGVLTMDPEGTPISAGEIDYAAGIALIDHWTGGTNPTVTVLSCLSQYGVAPVVGASLRTGLAPLRPEAFQVTCTAADGDLLIGTADADGNINAEWITGKCNYQFGTAALAFGQLGDDPEYEGEAPIPQVWLARPVDPTTLRYNAVAYSYLPIDAAILGLDPVRLPTDGRVPVFRDGMLVLVHHTQGTLHTTLTAGQVIDTGRTRLYRVVIEDSAGARLPADAYAVDRATGVVTLANPLDLAAYTAPFTLATTVADLGRLADVDINGDLTLLRPVTHDYPAPGSYVSGLLYLGTLQARVSNLFAQATWTGVWSDTRIGDEPLASYNDTLYPLVVTNAGAYTDRILIRFTSSTGFQVLGENLGLIAIGDVNTDCAPVNGLTGETYFTLDYRGWGGAWATGNCLRFNLHGANAPVDVIRAIQPSDPSDESDCVELLLIGNTDG